MTMPILAYAAHLGKWGGVRWLLVAAAVWMWGAAGCALSWPALWVVDQEPVIRAAVELRVGVDGPLVVGDVYWIESDGVGGWLEPRRLWKGRSSGTVEIPADAEGWLLVAAEGYRAEVLRVEVGLEDSREISMVVPLTALR